MPKTPAELLAEAIEAHRDSKYNGGQVTDPLDSTLYDAAVWFRVWQDHAADPNAPILAPELKEVAPGHLVAEFDPA